MGVAISCKWARTCEWVAAHEWAPTCEWVAACASSRRGVRTRVTVLEG
jgi:hypothetical protein